MTITPLDNSFVGKIVRHQAWQEKSAGIVRYVGLQVVILDICLFDEQRVVPGMHYMIVSCDGKKLDDGWEEVGPDFLMDVFRSAAFIQLKKSDEETH